jgi:hypothetical protein
MLKWRRHGKELFFLDPQDNIFTFDVNASDNAVKLATPRRPVSGGWNPARFWSLRRHCGREEVSP